MSRPMLVAWRQLHEQIAVFRQSDPCIGELELRLPAAHERAGHRRAVRTRVCQHSSAHHERSWAAQAEITQLRKRYCAASRFPTDVKSRSDGRHNARTAQVLWRPITAKLTMRSRGQLALSALGEQALLMAEGGLPLLGMLGAIPTDILEVA